MRIIRSEKMCQSEVKKKRNCMYERITKKHIYFEMKNMLSVKKLKYQTKNSNKYNKLTDRVCDKHSSALIHLDGRSPIHSNPVRSVCPFQILGCWNLAVKQRKGVCEQRCKAGWDGKGTYQNKRSLQNRQGWDINDVKLKGQRDG